ncbi:MAG: hypothetical protein ACYCTW_06610 [Sulfuricella sp.]
MKTSQQIFASFALSAGLLLALPGIAQADNDRPRVGINFSFGVPIYDQPTYVYAPPRPVYIYTQPRAVYYDQGYHDRSYYRRDEYYGHAEDHRQWHDHGDDHHDDEDD